MLAPHCCSASMYSVSKIAKSVDEQLASVQRLAVVSK